MPDPVAAREPLPSGTVTFAFTDIEGSTQRWERDPAAMQDAVRRHDALVRSAIVAHGGHVFKTVGDAFCAAFGRPEAAVAGMLAAQRALAAEDFAAVDGLRVRMALHTGTADERDGDYFGPTVNRVARLLAIGHGGQVLVSGITAGLLRGALPQQTTLRDLGEHRLKDLASPEFVFQVHAPDLSADFPPLRSLGVLSNNNLPRMLSSFLGREDEVAEITELLERHQLVTLVGSGGVGKTRISLQVAANLLDGSGDGVWFIELAPLTSGDYIPTTVAHALGLTLPAAGDPLANLMRALQPKHALLVFDNCEHLIDEAARVISALLRGCPRIKVLASSRQSLGIAGVATYRMPSLALPNATQDGAFRAADAMSYPATALFIERARAADRRFIAGDDNAAVILDICRRLDGIPLAIELAAARVKILSPRQLRERLDERFRVLAGGSRDVLPRQQTLRALIDWSHDLLDEFERALLRRLSIFVNGFTLEGACAVGSGDDLELDPFDVLASLVDKSLVLAEPDGDELHYHLLESTRAYALEKLEAAGERELAATRHLQFLRDRYAAINERLEATGKCAELDDAFAREVDDVRAALEFGLDRGKVAIGATLLVVTGFRAWSTLGLYNEFTTRAESFLATLPDDEPLLRARLWSGIAYLTGNLGHNAGALQAGTQAVALARAGRDSKVLVAALVIYAANLIRTRRYDDAATALDEAEALPDTSAAQRLDLIETRTTLIAQLDPGAAVPRHERLLEEHRSLGNAAMARTAMLNLAEWTHAASQTERAIELVRDMLPACRAAGDRNILVFLMANFAGYLAAADKFSEATTVAREIVRDLAQHEPTAPFLSIALEPLALALAHGGDLARAATLEGYADASLSDQGCEREFTETTTHERLKTLLAERLAPDDLARRLTEGAALSPEAAIALALEDP